MNRAEVVALNLGSVATSEVAYARALFQAIEILAAGEHSKTMIAQLASLGTWVSDNLDGSMCGVRDEILQLGQGVH